MSDGAVVDANIMPEYVKQSLTKSGDSYEVIHCLLVSCGLALNNVIEQEWTNICKSQYFKEWLADGYKNNQLVRIDECNLNEEVRKAINEDYGLTGRDIHYIKVANKTSLKYIITNDIDLFDPKAKTWPHEKKEYIKQNQKGELSKYLMKNLHIRVGLICHCKSDLEQFFPS